jgi:hypothetical protein
MPERRLEDDDELAAVRAGRTVPGTGKGPTALWTGEGDLIAVGIAEDGSIRPETVLG